MKVQGKSVIALMPMATLLAMNYDQLFALAKNATATSAKAKEATADFRASTPAYGKVIAALKRRFNNEQGNPLVATMTFPEFFKLKTGAAKVDTHAESCGKTFGAYVDNGLIAETDYDKCPSDALEKAASIVTETKGEISHPMVLKAADLLKDRPKDLVKQLQTIIEALKGPKTVDSEKAKEWLDTIFRSGLMTTVLAMTGAEIRNIKDPAKLQVYFEHLQIVLDGCGNADQQDAWLKDMDARKARSAPPTLNGKPVETAKPEAPATPAPVPTPAPVSEFNSETAEKWVADNYPGIDPESAAACFEEVENFFNVHHRLPEAAQELDQWAETPAESAAA